MIELETGIDFLIGTTPNFLISRSDSRRETRLVKGYEASISFEPIIQGDTPNQH